MSWSAVNMDGGRPLCPTDVSVGIPMTSPLAKEWMRLSSFCMVINFRRDNIRMPWSAINMDGVAHCHGCPHSIALGHD